MLHGRLLGLGGDVRQHDAGRDAADVRAADVRRDERPAARHGALDHDRMMSIRI